MKDTETTLQSADIFLRNFLKHLNSHAKCTMNF